MQLRASPNPLGDAGHQCDAVHRNISSSLVVDTDSNHGNVLIHAISIAVIGGALHHRARAARIKGIIQVAFRVSGQGSRRVERSGRELGLL